MVLVCFTCVLNCGFGYCEAGNGHGFWFQRSGIEVDEGVIHGQPTHCFFFFFWTIKNSVRPEKFQFLEKWQNRKFDYKIVNFG